MNNQYGNRPNNGSYNQYQQPYGKPNGYQMPPNGYRPQNLAQSGASNAEKEAVFSASGSIIMLILAFIGICSLAYEIISRFVALDFYGLLANVVNYVLELLIVIGFFLAFSHGRKKVLKSNGITLIRVPYMILFYFGIFVFVGSIVWSVLSENYVRLAISCVVFVFNCICFASVNKTLKVARDINWNVSTYGKRAGTFAAIMLIIFSIMSFASVIVNYFVVGGETYSGLLSKFLEGAFDVKVTSVIVAAITFLISIIAAGNMLNFAKKIKRAHGE